MDYSRRLRLQIRTSCLFCIVILDSSTCDSSAVPVLLYTTQFVGFAVSIPERYIFYSDYYNIYRAAFDSSTSILLQPGINTRMCTFHTKTSNGVF